MSYFQKTVLQKHIASLDKNTLSQAYKTFTACFHNVGKQANIAGSKEEQYQEGFLRDLFVDVLGYTLNPEPNYDLTTEFKNQKGAKKADGAILKDHHAIAVIELKGMDTTDLGKVEAQAFGYKNNQPLCRYVIISNFQKLRFYIDNAVEFIEFDLFTLTEDDFATLYTILHRDSLFADVAKKLKDSSLSQEEEVTKQLYLDYASFKRALFADLTANNPEINALTLFKKSQKLLDRLLFIFFAEDSGLLPANFARNIITEWDELKARKVKVPLYQRFCEYFEYLNTGYKDDNAEIFAYNGGLFKADEILDKVNISDAVLEPHIKKLADYDFASEVDVNILGHIFENSLTEIEEINAKLAGKPLDKKQKKRNKDGVFYTPKYITKYIVENTIGKLCSDKKAELGIQDDEFHKGRQKKTIIRLDKVLKTYRVWLLQLTICDPACGSGAFLNEALNFLMAEHAYIDELTAKLYGDSLVYQDVENSILENNLFGVDINEESVEIAKLSLWLRTAKPKRKLNTLNKNIKCGNSLIDDKSIVENAFDWKKEFQQVFAEGGFDVVIGNPPYVKEYTSRQAFDGLRDKDCYQGKMDLWYFFGNLALDIVKQEVGLISYIAPNNWITNAGASNFRNIFLKKGKLIEFVDFGDYKVFENAGIQTMIYTMIRSSNNDKYQLKYSKISNKRIKEHDVINFLDKQKSPDFTYFLSEISKKGYQDKLIHFIDRDLSKVLGSINAKKNYSFNDDEIAQGIVAPQDFLNEKNANLLGDDFQKGIGIFNLSNNEKKKYDFSDKELRLIKPFYTTEELGKYYGNPTNKLWVIYTGSEFNQPESLNGYPKLKNHLDKFQNVITSDNKPYGLHRARNEKFFMGEKIISLRKCAEPTFTYTDFDCYVSQTYFSIKTERVNMKFLTALLNSKLIKFWLRYKGKMQGDLFQVDKAPLMDLPIKTVDNPQPFIDKADQMLALNKALQSITQKLLRMLKREFGIDKPSTKLQSWHQLNDRDFFKELEKGRKKVYKNQNGTTRGFTKLKLADKADWEDYFLTEQQKAQSIQTQITATDKEIDSMVYELYNLNEDEIKIIEAC